MRRLVLALGALLSLAEALAFAVALYFLGTFLDLLTGRWTTGQRYGLGTVLWVLGGLLALGLAVLAGLLAVAAVHGRILGPTTRSFAVAALIVNGLVSVATVARGKPAQVAIVVIAFATLLLGLLLKPARTSAPEVT